MILETDRLILRPINLEDAPDIFEYASGPNVGVNAGWKPHESIEETIEIIKLVFLDKEDVFGIVLKSSGKVIGSIGLLKDPKREYTGVRMLGYALGESFWGLGYTTEAAKAVIRYGFDICGYELISTYRYPHNIRSGRVMEKCGFVYEGCLKMCEKLFNGEIVDNMCYRLNQNDAIKRDI